MLYAALWRSLPGPPWVRVLVCLLLFAAVVAVCFVWVFQWVAPLMPFNDNTVEPHASGNHAAYERLVA